MTKSHSNILKRVAKAKEIVLDVETSGLDWKSNYTVGYVITFSGDDCDSYYIPVRHRDNDHVPEGPTAGLLYPHPFEIGLSQVFEKHPTHIIGHNLAFDLKFLTRHCIDISNCTFEDTMINAGLINELRRSYSLENCCIDAKVQAKKGGPLYRYLSEKFGGHIDNRQMGNFWRLNGDDEMGIDYAKGDGTSTWQLWQDQQKDLDEQDLRTVWKIECRTIRVLHRMVMRGVKVDEDRLRDVSVEVKSRLHEAEAELPDGLNMRSSIQMKKLFDDAGINDYPSTDKGNPSFTEHWMSTNELGKKVVAARKYGNLINSFIAPMEEHLHAGRIHTEFNQSRSDTFGTITGRLSSSRPNMQQVPKRNVELGKLFRSVFVPDDGMKWASVDYSQCEPRLLTHYSKCKVLLAGYLSEPYVDAHTAVAKAANIDRTSGKRLNQGLLTGMGKAKLVEELGVSQEVGQAMYDDYFKKMPEIKVLQKQAASRMKNAGYVKSIMGRRARMDLRGGHDTSYKAINRLLQCGNADIIKKAMCDVDDYLEANGDTVHMLLSIHDAIDFQFYEKDRHIYEGALEIMQDYGPNKSVELLVPMIVDAGEGKNWAEATYG